MPPEGPAEQDAIAHGLSFMGFGFKRVNQSMMFFNGADIEKLYSGVEM